MKVLFAVNNENISNLIVKKYQQQYKEIITFKNVYYFNAILKEIQKDKTYDRIVISEDLEQFTNSNYQQMDKFIFDRLDSISDEASNMQGENIPIILICSERRNKGEEILVKLFGIGIYDAVIGKDRDINEVCELIYRPRSKKEAKEYYKIDAEDVNYQSESENDVSEVEIQNILAHYKRLGKNEQKYVESFDNIALQYNDVQLKIICKFLPLNVRAVLEESSPRYQKLMSFNKSVSNVLRTKEKKETGTSEKLLVTPNSKNIMSKPVVIPSTIKSGEVKKLTKTKREPEEPIEEKIIAHNTQLDYNEESEKDNVIDQQAKRGRGRPKKILTEEEQEKLEEKQNQPKRGRGRPKKVHSAEEQLPGLDEEEKDNQDYFEEIDSILPGFDDIELDIDKPNKEDDNFALPGVEDIEDEAFELPGIDLDDEVQLPGFEEELDVKKETHFEEDAKLPGVEIEEDFPIPDITNSKQAYNQGTGIESALKVSKNEEHFDTEISQLLTRDKKIVAMVGTSKNGTSFILNNLAELLSSQGINVAILDATQNKNSYYIYTKNEETLRKTAFESIENLSNGIANGIKVNSNLTVYTSLPSQNEELVDTKLILETLIKNHSLILIDCDFKTPLDYFANAQEIYLVQSMDVLTIQPLTAFLRELKAKGILQQSKLRIIINKYIKLRNITEKAIIGGMAFYNDPAMAFMTELFDRNTVRYFTIPFEAEIYEKYLEGLINCDISLKGYSKLFMQTLKQLGNSILPLVSERQSYKPASVPKYQTGFSSNMNNTLNQMKKNY